MILSRMLALLPLLMALSACVQTADPSPALDGDSGQAGENFDVSGGLSADVDTLDSDGALADAGDSAGAMPDAAVALGSDVGAVAAAKFVLIPSFLIFNAVKSGTSGAKQFKILNNGDVLLKVHKVDFSGDPFFELKIKTLDGKELSLKSGPGKSLEIKPPITLGKGESLDAVVVFSPVDDQGKQGTIFLASNGFNSQVNKVLVSGVGVTSLCPTSKVIVTEGQAVIPQTLLHLGSVQFKGKEGAPIKKYKWTAKQPLGSKQVFSPSSTSPNPTFIVQLAGDYELCLVVWDEDDVESCKPACVKVVALPDEVVYIELLWRTPGDPDETDIGPSAGADMDLHFAHWMAGGPDIDCDGQGDPWYSASFDTFWSNPNPKWGNAGSLKDDPSLLLDDPDGAGPELLILKAAEGTVNAPTAYSVGVHYWNDHGFGDSFATIHIYIMGALAVKIDQVKMSVLDMWYVGKINWPNAMSGGVLSPFKACYMTKGGDPCKKTGDYWQAPGDWCMSKCYVNPSFTDPGSGAKKSVCKP